MPANIWGQVRNVLPLSTTSALEHRQVRQQLTLSGQFLLALQKITDLSARTSSLDHILPEMADMLSETLGFPIISIERYDAARQLMVIEAVTGIDLSQIDSREASVNQTLSGTVIQTRQPLVHLFEADGAEPSALSVALENPHPLKTFICLPMIANQRVIGTLNLAHPEVILETDYLCHLGTSLAGYLAALVEGQQLRAKTQAPDHLAPNQSTENHSIATLPFEDGKPQSNDQPLTQLVNAIKVVIFQTDTTGVWTFLNQAWEEITDFSLQESLGQRFSEFVHPDDRQHHLETFQLFQTSNASTYRHEAQYLNKQGGTRWVEVLAQLKRASDGTVVGSTGTLTDITERKRIEARVMHDALHDSLTGLPNRVLFMDRLEQAHRNYQRDPKFRLAVLCLDLDDFKAINDNRGHLVGDQLLIAVAERLQSCLRPGDTVSRFGGDEFTLLLPNIGGMEDAILVGDRLLKSLSVPFNFNNKEVLTSGSIGIAISSHPTEQPADLVRNADIALYQAKASGKARWEVCQPSTSGQTVARDQLEKDLKQALEQKEFRLHYQPIVCLATGTVQGLIAHLYWHHPTQGRLPHRSFQSVAEDSGLSNQIGGWMLQEACQQLQAWQQYSATESPLVVSVGLSERHLMAPELLTQVEISLSHTQLKPNQLRLEVSQALLNEPTKALIHTLTALHEKGVGLCLRLKDYPPPSLKQILQHQIMKHLEVDSTLVGLMARGQNRNIVQQIAILGQDMGISLTAAGIETVAQLAQLKALQFQEGWGGYFSPKLSASEVIALLQRSSLYPVISKTSGLLSPELIVRTNGTSSLVSLVGQTVWSIGRSSDRTITLNDPLILPNQGQIQRMETGDYYFVDLGNGDGTQLNDQPISMPVCLQDGDRLTLGQTVLEFQYPAPEIADTSKTEQTKQVLMVQSSNLQGQIWQEALTSQGLALTWLNSEVDLMFYLNQHAESGEDWPHLLLLDMTVLRPNPYSFCRWCRDAYPSLKIILTSGTRTSVPDSERKWAVHQGAVNLLSAFPEQNLFANIIDIVAKVKFVLQTLEWKPIEQHTLSSSLLSIGSVARQEAEI